MDSQIYLESIEPMDGLSNLKSIPTTRWSQARFPAFSETSVRQTRDACGIQTLNYKDHNYKTKKVSFDTNCQSTLLAAGFTNDYPWYSQQDSLEKLFGQSSQFHQS